MDRSAFAYALAAILIPSIAAAQQSANPPHEFAVAELASQPVSPSDQVQENGPIEEYEVEDNAVSVQQDVHTDGKSCLVECCCPEPGFYFSAQTLVLHRDNQNRDRTIVENALTFASLVETNDFDFDWEVGQRVTIGRDDGCGGGVHFSYFQLDDWSDRVVVLGTNDLTLPNDIGLATFDFLDADRMQLDYRAEVQNYEINFTQTSCCDPCVQWLFGFRYLNLDEMFNINSFDPAFGTSDYNILARNDLYGGQFGVIVNHDDGCKGWRLTAKAGLFTNEASQSTFLGDFNNTFVFRDLTANKTNATFLGEVNLSAYWQLGCRTRLVAGYNLLWLEGIALAPQQLDFTDTPASSNFVNTNGGILMHGANVGLEVTW